MDVKITYFKKECAHNIIARFGIYCADLYGLNLNDLKVIKKKNKDGWFIAVPNFKLDDNWKPIISFIDTIQKDLLKAIYDEIHKYLREQEQQPEKPSF